VTRLRVLLADDHLPTLEELRDTLCDDVRFTVVAAVTHAAAAVSEALRARPDLCVLDISMPGNGIAACWEITARLPQTTVVMFTVSAADIDLFAALRAGASGYLLKDADPAEIPELLAGATTGKAAIPPELVARMVHHFRGRAPRRRQLAEPVPLTSREWEVLELMGRKLTNAQIAHELSVSPITVRTHVSGILRKLRVSDRDTAVRMLSVKE
jgi:DNA-binding NarL/FixJ family response regulator